MNNEKLKYAMEHWYSKTPDSIHGVARGYKTTNGVRTNELCVVFMVVQKKPLAELKQEEILPSSLVIDNETIKTDVVQMARFQTASHQKVVTWQEGLEYMKRYGNVPMSKATGTWTQEPPECNKPAIAKDGLPFHSAFDYDEMIRAGTAAHVASRRPLKGGISIGPNETYQGSSEFPPNNIPLVGTLGGLFRDKEDGSVVALTALHVVVREVADYCSWSSYREPQWQVEASMDCMPGPTYYDGLNYPADHETNDLTDAEYKALLDHIYSHDHTIPIPIPENDQILRRMPWDIEGKSVVQPSAFDCPVRNSVGELLDYRCGNSPPIIGSIKRYIPLSKYSQTPYYYQEGNEIILLPDGSISPLQGDVQPPTPIPSSDPDYRKDYNYCDAAVISIDNAAFLDSNSGSQLGPTSLVNYPIATTSEIDGLIMNGIRLIKSGRTTGYIGAGALKDTPCRIEALYDSVQVDLVMDSVVQDDSTWFHAFKKVIDPQIAGGGSWNCGEVTFNDQILIGYVGFPCVGTPASPYCVKQWIPQSAANGIDGEYHPCSAPINPVGTVMGGDSGQIVLGDFGGTLKIVGLIIGSAEWGASSYCNPYGAYDVGIMSRIDRVMSQLNLEAIGPSNLTAVNPPANWSYIDMPAAYHEPGTRTVHPNITFNGRKYWECGKLPNGNTKYVTYTPVVKTVPSKPRAVVVTAGYSRLTVTWTVPADNGNSPISDYLVQYSSNGGSTWTPFTDPVSSATSCVVTGLTNGTEYIIRVYARNAIGDGPISDIPSPVKPVGEPGPPTSVVATRGNASLAVVWVAPANNGGSAITDYLVKYSSNNGSTFTNFVHPVSTATACTVTGLINGTPYVIKVIAKNAIGIGPASANSAPVVPATVPGVPTKVVSTIGFNKLVVKWVGPVSDGGSAITNYPLDYSSNNGASWTRFDRPASSQTSCVVTGLTNGTAYVIRVSAGNAVGYSAASVPSLPVVPAITVPDQATALVVTKHNAGLNVNWNAPLDNGGSAITQYVVKYQWVGSSTWSIFRRPASTVTSCLVTGLTNGRPYVIKVIAQNARGISLPTATSQPVTPITVPGSPTNVESRVGGPNSLIVSWLAPSNRGGSPITDYRIDYSFDNFVSYSTVSHTASIATSITITNLEQGTAYIIRVFAKNLDGYSVASSNSVPVTPATVPGPPRSLVAINRPQRDSSGNWTCYIELTWNAPLYNGGSAITDYVIQHSMAVTDVWGRPRPPSSYTIGDPVSTATSLLYSTSCENPKEFFVFAKNFVGRSSQYAYVSFESGFTIPDTLTGVVATKNSSGGLVVTWDLPSVHSLRGGTHFGYLVEYSIDNGSSWTLFGITGYSNPSRESDRSITITGLPNNGTYVVRAFVETSEGFGLPSANSAPVTF